MGAPSHNPSQFKTILSPPLHNLLVWIFWPRDKKSQKVLQWCWPSALEETNDYHFERTLFFINVTCQGHSLVKLVHFQRAILECNFKSEGRLRSLIHTEHAHIRQSATMARDVVLRRSRPPMTLRGALLTRVLRSVPESNKNNNAGSLVKQRLKLFKSV